MQIRMALMSVGVMLSACSTSDPGWRGSGAEPFEQALAECQQKASIVSEKENREHLLNDCMGAKGWHRPVR